MTVHGVPLIPGKRVNTKLIHHPPGRVIIFIAVMVFVHGKSEFFYTQKRLFGIRCIRFMYKPKTKKYSILRDYEQDYGKIFLYQDKETQ